MGSTDQVADLAKAALKSLEGSGGAQGGAAAPRFATNDLGAGYNGGGSAFGGAP